MSRIPVYYTIQNSEDGSMNIFFLPSNFKNPQDLKVRDIVDHFPMKLQGKSYHFRFNAFCDRDVRSWVDISNLNAKVPTVEGNIILKVLVLDRAVYSRIFRSYKPGETVSQPVSQPVPEMRKEPSREAPREQTREQPREQPRQQQQQTNNSLFGQPINKASSEPARNVKERSQPQQQEANLLDDLDSFESKPKVAQPQNTNFNQPSKGAMDFDLIGGGEEEEVKFSGSNTKQSDEAVYSMSREELTVYKEQQKEAAIQEKLADAKKIWDKEQSNQADKEKAYAEFEDAIRKWSGKDGQRNNIRTLLCTVHSIAWEGVNWNPLSFSDLMSNGSVKKYYYKAVTIFHPDKNQEGTYKQKYISERVTNELNAAWDEFRKTNP